MLGAFTRAAPRHHRGYRREWNSGSVPQPKGLKHPGPVCIREDLMEHTIDGELPILSRHSLEGLGIGGKTRDAFARQARRLV